MKQDDAVFVRIPKALKKKLQEMAKGEQRNLSNFILVKLTEAVENDEKGRAA